LYGVVQHSGSLRGGHYIAYVKYAMDQCDFVTVKSTEDIAEGADGSKYDYSNAAKGADPEPGTCGVGELYQELDENNNNKIDVWCCTNDSWITIAKEAEALESQAYLLLYVKHK